MSAYKRLAEVIRKFDDIGFLAATIEGFEREDQDGNIDIDDLADMLTDELSYAEE